MADVVILNKTASIERCLKRILDDYAGHEAEFTADFMRQDAVIFNIQRACEQTIDLANHIVKIQKSGIPQSSRGAFDLLAGAGIIEVTLAQRLGSMVGFRNIAVHDYQKINLAIVTAIIHKHLVDFQDFIQVALGFA
jgi:uncharacterized protein YutE (UPF0331/DUF86 family)